MDFLSISYCAVAFSLKVQPQSTLRFSINAFERLQVIL